MTKRRLGVWTAPNKKCGENAGRTAEGTMIGAEARDTRGDVR